MKIALSIVSILCILSTYSVHAQLDLPLFSEPAFLSQKVGHTTFNLTYERPKQNDRVIFGELVPYDEVWRTGAGECTKIKFDKAVYIDLKKIPAGNYSLFSIPAKDSWTFILNRDTTLYGSYNYDPKLDVVRVKVPLRYSDQHTESMQLFFDVVDDKAILHFSWDHMNASVELDTRTYPQLLAQVDDLLHSNSNLEADVYTNTADYIIHNKSGFGPEYLEYADRLMIKSFSIGQPSSFAYRVKTDILKLQNNKEEFIEVSHDHIRYLEEEKPYQGYEHSISEIREAIKNFGH